MNCGVDRHDVELFFDADLQEHVLMEGTCRAQEIGHLGTIYTKCPLNFNINNLAPLEVPREETAAAAAAAGDTAAAQQQQDATAAAAAAAAADNKTAADILTESTEAEEEKGAPKSAMQIDFEKTAGINSSNNSLHYLIHRIVMGNDKVLPINVVVDRIMEGQV
ncbi:myosin light chain 2, putative [Eimeria maxima]|uniref:Myosin light chain 2, putative n=1 Tax=Eimeria maxima TaxID=5804 RepID=U6M5N2_EIMMA|nr:myosin light chain 2, putative [Eimeria maxima]CDJ57759.1 myosin light chain 2, putative [Eimeria maxima]